MGWQRMATILIPLGALGMLIASTAFLDTFASLASAATRSAGTEYQTDQFRLAMLVVGFCSALLFAIGMVAAVCGSLRPSRSARTALMFAVVGLAVGFVLIAIGHTHPVNAFNTLATAESIDIEAYEDDCAAGVLPTRVGYVLVLASAVAIAAARLLTPGPTQARWTAASIIMLVIAIGASLILAGSHLVGVLAALRFERALSAEGIMPAELAAPLSTMAFVGYAVVLSLVGFFFVALRLASLPGAPSSESPE